MIRPDVLLRHLPFFLAVAEEKSLAGAAARLNVAQSALSRRIRLLEWELGDISLFERSRTGMELLPAGEVLLSEAQQVRGIIERAVRQVTAVAGGSGVQVTGGFVEAATRCREILGALAGLEFAHPEIALKIGPLFSEEQRAGLVQQTIDFGLLQHDPAENIVQVLAERGARIQAVPILYDPFVAALARDHPLAGRSELHLRDIAEEPLIWPSRKSGSDLFGRMQAVWRARGLTPRVAMETAASATTMHLVEAGIGLGLVGASMSDHVPPGVVLRTLADFPVEMQLSLVWRVDSSPTVRTAVAFLQDHLPAGLRLSLPG